MQSALSAQPEGRGTVDGASEAKPPQDGAHLLSCSTYVVNSETNASSFLHADLDFFFSF